MPQFARRAARSQDTPEVCKNCMFLTVPTEYSDLKEIQHTRLPFCSAAKGPKVGFEYAAFRECEGYDPIVKSIGQKVESKAPESQQTEADVNKIKVPIRQKAEVEVEAAGKPRKDLCFRCGKAKAIAQRQGADGVMEGLCARCSAAHDNPAEKKEAAALPSAAPEAVAKKESQAAEWCRKNRCHAPRGERHPAHDWCTLWNTACDNLVVLPSGSAVPRSMAFQSSEVGGDGGAHQFGRSPNQ